MHYTPCSKKGDRDTKLMAVTPLIVNPISIFFNFQIFQSICSEVFIKDPTSQTNCSN